MPTASKLVIESQAVTQRDPRSYSVSDCSYEHSVASLSNSFRSYAQESHCSPIHVLAFNHLSTEWCNLFATVGKDQVSVPALSLGHHVALSC